GSLPWLVEALRQDEGKPEREAMQRLRIGAVLRDCPKLTDLWFPPAPVIALTFFGDRLRAITTDDNKAQVWDALTGAALSVPLVHTYPIQSAAFSPAGDRVVLGGRAGKP